MFVYAYRLVDRYAREIASLAVLADASPEWRPSGFEIGRTDAIFAIEESLAMPYVSFVERRGEARGRVPNPSQCTWRSPGGQ